MGDCSNQPAPEDDICHSQKNSPLKTMKLNDNNSDLNEDIREPGYSELVFGNPLLLQNIFDRADLNSIKKSRLVSYQWNKAATFVLSNVAALNINKLFTEPTERITTIPAITTDLVKYIACTFDSVDDVDENRVLDPEFRLSKPHQLVHFCEEYPLRIHGIMVNNSDGNDLIRPLLKILRICKNLESLDLRNYGNDEQATHTLVDFEACLPRSQTLKTFYWETRYYDVPVHLERFISDIISTAPNLVSLFLDNNCYPNLSCNTKLKRLNVRNYSYDSSSNLIGNYSVQKLQKMLKQVSTSLEELFLQFSDCTPPADFTDVLEIPEMPKLKIFVNKGLQIYPMRSMRSLGTLPNLVTLKLGGEWMDIFNVDTFFKTSVEEGLGSTTFASVKTLELGQFENVSVLETVSKVFPRLSNCTFYFGRKDNTGHLTNAEMHTQIEEVFRTLSTVDKLEHLQLNFDWYCELKALANAFFVNSKLFRGLKTMVIHNGEFIARNYDLDASFYELITAFMPTRYMKLCELTGFHMSPEIAGEILKFILDKKLPVKFKTSPRLALI